MGSTYRQRKKRHAHARTRACRRYRLVRRNKARPHGTFGPDLRGNYKDRAARKRWMLKTFGNGKTAKCVHCGKTVNYDTLTADRIIPGCEGGRYRRDNIQPSCGPCNSGRNFRICGIAPEDDPREAMMAAVRRNGFSRHKWKRMKRRAAA